MSQPPQQPQNVPPRGGAQAPGRAANQAPAPAQAPARGGAIHALAQATAPRVPPGQQLERRESLPLARLKIEEEKFFGLVKKGDPAAVKGYIQNTPQLNLNCINYQGMNALCLAIDAENIEMIEALCDRPDIDFRDAHLHAVATGNTEVAKKVFDYMRVLSPELEKQGCPDSSDYSPDITPMAVAAMNDDYKMIQMLIERGHDIRRPHNCNCLCEECKAWRIESIASFSRRRLNAYKAVCSPAYICQKSHDPILEGFELAKEIKECGQMDKEFKVEYCELSEKVKEFIVGLLDQCRDESEVETLLRLPWGYEEAKYKKIPFPRLQLALDYQQKKFVAHSMIQQVLTTKWLGDFQSWRQYKTWRKILNISLQVVLLPVICLTILYVPLNNRAIRKLKSPINRYLLHFTSYIFFLIAIFAQNMLSMGNYRRGSPKTGLESVIIIFVLGHIWDLIKLLRREGFVRFFGNGWRCYDLAMQMLFVLTFFFWAKSDIDAQTERAKTGENLERKFWHSSDSSLLHEGFFAVGTILAYARVTYFCLQSSFLGPLQVSVGKMAHQILYFNILAALIILGFSNALTRMYAYYANMKQTDADGNSRVQIGSFTTMKNSIVTLFWALLCMSPAESTDVVVENLSDDKIKPDLNSHDFTQFVGTMLFAAYHVMMVVALLNTLIAILSNTFQKVIDNADVEFKFARTKQWVYFYNNDMVMPSPFNLMPPLAILGKCNNYARAASNKIPNAKAKFSLTRCCYIEYDEDAEVDTRAYENLMSNLVQRYFRAEDEEDED